MLVKKGLDGFCRMKPEAAVGIATCSSGSVFEPCQKKLGFFADFCKSMRQEEQQG